MASQIENQVLNINEVAPVGDRIEYRSQFRSIDVLFVLLIIILINSVILGTHIWHG